jgi:predicted ester cyclase
VDYEAHYNRSQSSLAAVKRMELALGASEKDMSPYFHEDFEWRGNRGCGVKHGLDAFVTGWQLPFRRAFSDRVYKTEQFLADGEWASCFGYVDAIHSGTFMGIPATGKRVRIPYMDFWKVEEGRISDNPVSVDFASVLAQLGVDVFSGQGWETMGATPSEDTDQESEET